MICRHTRTQNQMSKISRPLGRGSFGFVSLAVSQPTDEARLELPSFMAVKSAENFPINSLEKECNLHRKLDDCPHILRCFGGFVSEQNGVLYYSIRLEYASGGSLAYRIRSSNGGLPDYEVRWYTKCLLKGLSHIHKQGYVHCDIKPHNILLVGGSSPFSLRTRRKMVELETVKIADFGQAKKAGKNGKDEESKMTWRGTPLYLAPECILHREYEPCSDIWALGCTVLEMITGKPAWKYDLETEACALLYRIGFTRQVPDVPTWVCEDGKDFVRKCLVRDPKSRWTADMLLCHPFVSTKMMMPLRESMRKES
ncbi:Mitogen-activated protein kinase kinase [Actinidia chinensis var. chinensis]|uniref:Mitogen-activated protein kinase kinase n=1 Tax=Actinidia chinensis var. chinensis TaxID=1590841 RepID=A0A2R6PHN4_ACTCC|nr:Mitogen-activated protein kinase kinase [Actinidia chinensis var. chinensis]